MRTTTGQVATPIWGSTTTTGFRLIGSDRHHWQSRVHAARGHTGRRKRLKNLINFKKLRSSLVGLSQVRPCSAEAKHPLCAPSQGANLQCDEEGPEKFMQRQNAHVIVLGNEKGGSGKSTTAFHLAVYLLYEGFRVATIDADSRQQTFTAYVRNRRNWARGHNLDLPHSTHFHLPQTGSDSAKENGRLEFEMFRQAV